MNAYDKITNQIIEALEQGLIPWKQPWMIKAQMPESIYGKAYRGINAFWLGFVAWRKGYEDNRWLTFGAAKARGGKVRKGEKSEAVTLWIETYNHESPCTENDRKKKCNKLGRKGKCKKFLLMRYYSVFNVSQCDDLDITPRTIEPVQEFNPIEEAQQIADNYLSREAIELKTGGAAYYTPSEDTITVPKPERFNSIESYYTTLFHECGHSTGHEKRLNRKDSKSAIHFGDTKYAKEELAAEMTSAFLSAQSGVHSEVEDKQRVAYIQSWLKALRDDKKLVVIAAAQAQKAAEYILQ